MRNVIFGMNISIDSCYDHTKFNPDPHDEIMDYFTQQMHDVDVMVYGRKMYELMFPYWSDVAKAQSATEATNTFAETITGIDKIIFSRTLNSVQGNARIVRDNLEEEILKLKQQPGKKISIAGVNLRSQLTELGLVDEFYFVIHPIIVGDEKRLDFKLQECLNLKLIDSRVFKTGAIGVHYAKR